jgi:hypothetical protein
MSARTRTENDKTGARPWGAGPGSLRSLDRDARYFIPFSISATIFCSSAMISL